MPDRYEPATFEAKWRERWQEAELFRTRENPEAEKYYGLDFFPYPSGAGLSVGHCRNYVPPDAVCRMKIMQGYNVLHPMGFDAFGLPAENEAIKRHTHPAPMIERYADRYRSQMDLIGISYDWSRSFKSSDPPFYRWTQWIFELMYKRGLAYRKMASVNWDPVDKTVLADEEVIAGRAERSGALVEKKWIPQWFFKITDYAQRLLDDLDEINWPEGIKTQQRNWIGRSEGVQFSMHVVFLLEKESKSQPIKSPEAPSDRSELDELEAEIRASGFEPSAKAGLPTKIGTLTTKLAEAADSIRPHDAEGFDKAASKIKSTAPIGSSIREDVLRQMRSGASDWEFLSQPHKLRLEVFTTRIDTIFGMTFCVLAPEHALVEKILEHVPTEFQEKIREYQTQAKSLSEADRQATSREKTGVFTGAYAINPANAEFVPIWLADYVLATYGTGAIMAVPAHDQRDFDFALKFGLDVVPVIKPTTEYLKEHSDSQTPFDETAKLAQYIKDVKKFNPVFESKDSTLINSGEYTGQTVADAQTSLGEWIEGLGTGQRKVQFKLRDWLVSRQRYWGCPIPVIHSKDGEIQLAPEDSLPIELPWVEQYEPSGDGTSPLAGIPEFVNVTDLDGRLGHRETDTMSGFACSSWYFLRFCDPFNDEAPWSQEKVDYWMPVDCYVGGSEHAVMHLLYARFWTKVLYDAGLVKCNEPFKELHNQGQVLGLTAYRKPQGDEQLGVGEEGILLSNEEAANMPPDQIFRRWARMSKSKGNVVTPEEAVTQYGADALRLYLLFRAPFEADIEWENKGMEDLARFLSRVFRIVDSVLPEYQIDWKDHIDFQEPDSNSSKIRRFTHQTIRNVTTDLVRFGFNTYVSWLMKFVNELNPFALAPRGGERVEHTPAEMLALSEAVDALVLLLAPGAPHSSDELWEVMGHHGFTLDAGWPRFIEGLALESSATIAVQVNGKLRDTFEIGVGASSDEHERAAKLSAKVVPHLEGKTIRKVIVVPGKLVNIVVN